MIWSTWIAFGDRPQIVVFRVIFSLAIAIFVGCIFSIQKDPQELLQTSFSKRYSSSFKTTPQSLSNNQVSPLLQSGTFLVQQGTSVRFDNSLSSSSNLKPASASSQWQLFFDNLLQEFSELGGMLIFGSAIAAVIQVFVPREVVLTLGQDTITSIMAMMLLAAIVSICSTVDSFFALSFAATFTSGSLLAFLVFGPTIDIKSIGLMTSIFKPRILLYIFTLVAQLTFIFTLAYSYFY